MPPTPDSWPPFGWSPALVIFQNRTTSRPERSVATRPPCEPHQEIKGSQSLQVQFGYIGNVQDDATQHGQLDALRRCPPLRPAADPHAGGTAAHGGGSRDALPRAVSWATIPLTSLRLKSVRWKPSYVRLLTARDSFKWC